MRFVDNVEIMFYYYLLYHYMRLVGYRLTFPIFYLHMLIDFAQQVIKEKFPKKHYFCCPVFLDKLHPIREEKVNELSKYLPLRFLICMISAISNPFLYSYFNETFKDGLKRIFSLCCPQINREINQIDYSTNKMKTEKNHLIKNLKSESNYKHSSMISNRNGTHSRSISRSSHDPSTRLTILYSNQFSSSISSHM